jgi:putative ABC transport system permease protein
MTGSVPLARRNLLRQRMRFALSVGGVGMALLLVLSLQAIYNAILDQVTAYPDNAGAPVIASQRGVETMHMSNSAIPIELARRLERDARVERAAPILYVSVVLGERKPVVSYLIGYRDGGGPWAMAEGSSRPRGDQIVLDVQTADRLGAGLGSRVTVFGRELRIVGLARDTTSILSTIAFVDYATFAHAARLRDTASYVLLWPRAGLSPGDLAGGLQRDYPITAQTRERFSEQERQVISDMSTGLIRGMTVIGFVVGLAVAGLSMYTATTARLREYAVLKAIGMRNARLYALITRQAFMTVAGGLALSLALLWALSAAMPRLSDSTSFMLTGGSLVQAVGITAAIAVLAALAPVRRVARVDPASVYRS